MNRLLFVVISLLLFSHTFAATTQEIEQKWNKKFPSMTGAKIEASPIKGLYMVVIPPRVFYVDAEVNYLVEGSILNVNNNLSNETSPYRRQATLLAINAFEPTMIKFSPEGETRHIVTVFTDVDCAYCRKLHSEMPEYNKLGIEIRYLAWPRSGENTPSFKKSEAVWCADDKKKAITLAKLDKKFASKTCDNPVKQHQALGELLGVRGTPALVLETGELVPGYKPAKVLGQALDDLKKRLAKKSEKTDEEPE